MAEVVPTTVPTPDLTETINQEFFIEPQGGAQHPISYLDRFPDTVYNKSLDSNLVALMYAILGPSGLGQLRENYLQARLEVESQGLSTIDLDNFYANPIGLARLANETYETDPTGLLPTKEWTEIEKSDASYRKRAQDFLAAARAGGTLLGLTLAARSGLNRPVEIIENYRALYDEYADVPLGLEWMGSTRSTEEVIVLPRQNVPKSSVQTLNVYGNPNKGTFTMVFPAGETAKTTTANLEYNSTWDVVRSALESVATIGKGNVRVTGGPFPSHPMQVEFTGELADTEVPTLELIPGASMTNAEGKLATAAVEVNQVGVAADGETAHIPPRDWHYALTAIDQIKPVTTIVTPGKASGITKRVVSNNTSTDSAFIDVIRYVTGNSKVVWPSKDATHWIENSKEREAPVSENDRKHHYIGFHNIASITAYTEEGLKDPHYEGAEWPKFVKNYFNEHIGEFSAHQKSLFPFLQAFKDPSFEFRAKYSEALPVEPLTIKKIVQGIPMVRGIYPVDYNGLPGVPKRDLPPGFWASRERNEGSDHLEIDLGSVQVVNYVTFEATGKPYDIEVFYDILDESPSRTFHPVTMMDHNIRPSVLSLGYDPIALNPWKKVTLNFTNSLGLPIYTRYLRLSFKKRLEERGPFWREIDRIFLPFSIETKNLRVGRNIS